MIDVEVPLLTVTDLKQFIYCPRILYYHTCLPDVRPTTYKMEDGIEAHMDEKQKALRRKTWLDEPVERRFDVALVSSKLGLSGQLDELLMSDSQAIPIDYKMARRGGNHYTMQLAAYALLVEDVIGLRVETARLYLVPIKKTEIIAITPALRRKVQQALQEMRLIAETERQPPPTEWRQRCFDCEFRRFCNDV